MTADTPTSVAVPSVEETKPVNGSSASENAVGERLINALAKSFAAQVTATLVEELAAAKDALAKAKKEKEGEAAAAAKAETETETAEAKEAEKDKETKAKKEKTKRVDPKDMLKELYKIDSVCRPCCFRAYEGSRCADVLEHSLGIRKAGIGNLSPGMTHAPAKPMMIACPMNTRNGS
jgi:hypothetical protein